MELKVMCDLFLTMYVCVSKCNYFALLVTP